MEHLKEFFYNSLKYITVERIIFVSAILLYYIKKKYGKRITLYVRNTNNVIDDMVWDAVCIAEVTLNGKASILKFGGAKIMAVKAIIDSGIALPTDNTINELIEKNHKKLETKLSEIKGDIENGKVEEHIEKDMEHNKDNINKNISHIEMDNNKPINKTNETDNNSSNNTIQEIQSNEKVEIHKADNELLKDILKINEGVTATQMWANVAVTNKGFKLENTNIGATVGVKWFPK